MDDIVVYFLVGGLMFVCTLAFFVIMFFFPEWLGISGKKAQEIRDEHRGTSEPTER